VAGNIQNNKTPLWQSAALALLAAFSAISRVDWQKKTIPTK
jgi:hypothetical protein